MNVSKNRALQLYQAVSENITDARLSVIRWEKTNEVTPTNVDRLLFDLEIKIWADIRAALNMQRSI